MIKKRIVGLTSYYEYQDKRDYPVLKPINIVQVPMSEFQFGTYERFRHQEIEDDKIKRRRQNPEDDDDTQSSYRIKSRLSCTFAFPEEIGNLQRNINNIYEFRIKFWRKSETISS